MHRRTHTAQVQQLTRFPKILRAAPEIPANVRLTGLRGVGKTVLLKEPVVFANRLPGQSRPAVALLLDEAQVIRDDTGRNRQYPMSMFIAAVNALQEAGLPLGLVLCGLPTLAANLQNARTYSERMFQAEEIGALQGNPGPARDAFVQPLAGTGIEADEDLVSRVLAEVEGYPFFIQLWGAELWEATQDARTDRFTLRLLDAIESEICARLDVEFYAGRIETLTPSEQDLVLATAACPYPPLRTSDIRSRSTRSGGNINGLMGRLTEQGVILRVQKGLYEYTAPKLHEYLKRRSQHL